MFAYFMPQWADWNIDSRLDLVHAIVDQHTVHIDRYHQNTWDKAVYRGHYYSDKAPGTSLLGLPVYAAFITAEKAPGLGAALQGVEANSAWNVAIALGRRNTQKAPAPQGTNLGGCQRSGTSGNVQYIPWGNRLVPPMRQWALSKYLVTIGTDGLFSALFVTYLFLFLGWFSLSLLTRWLTTIAYAFGTVTLPYSSNFYSHQIAAAMLFTSFGLLVLRRQRRAGGQALPAAGFLLGASILVEYTVAIIVVILALYALVALGGRLRSLAALVAGGVPPIAALLAYNRAAFGSPLDTGYSHDFCWSAAQAAGVAGFTYPHLGPLFDLTIGPYRGLFFTSPFLLLAVPGWVLLSRRGLRLEAATCAAVAVVFVLALSAYWGWNGGQVDGPRYLVPAVPFLGFPAAFAVERAWSSPFGRALALLFGASSVLATWLLFLGGDTFPISWLRNPLLDYSLPQLAGNHVTSNAGLFLGLTGWTTLLPLAGLVALILTWPGRWGRESAAYATQQPSRPDARLSASTPDR